MLNPKQLTFQDGAALVVVSGSREEPSDPPFEMGAFVVIVTDRDDVIGCAVGPWMAINDVMPFDRVAATDEASFSPSCGGFDFQPSPVIGGKVF